jgi:hypothetical protein
MKMWDERRWIWEAKRLLKMEEDEALTCLSMNIIMEVSFNVVGLFGVPFVWGWPWLYALGAYGGGYRFFFLFFFFFYFYFLKNNFFF